MCDVSKLITEERHTHSNIHGWTPEHEIIIHHWCIIVLILLDKFSFSKKIREEREFVSIYTSQSASTQSLSVCTLATSSC
jgi:hypothetical protein